MRLAELPLLRLDRAEQLQRRRVARRARQDGAVGALGAGQIAPLMELERALE